MPCEDCSKVPAQIEVHSTGPRYRVNCSMGTDPNWGLLNGSKTQIEDSQRFPCSRIFWTWTPWAGWREQGVLWSTGSRWKLHQQEFRLLKRRPDWRLNKKLDLRPKRRLTERLEAEKKTVRVTLMKSFSAWELKVIAIWKAKDYNLRRREMDLAKVDINGQLNVLKSDQ